MIGHQNVTKLVNAVKVSDNPTLHRDTIKDCFIALITQDLHVIKRELDNLLQDINEKGILVLGLFFFFFFLQKWINGKLSNVMLRWILLMELTTITI